MRKDLIQPYHAIRAAGGKSDVAEEFAERKCRIIVTSEALTMVSTDMAEYVEEATLVDRDTGGGFLECRTCSAVWSTQRSCCSRSADGARRPKRTK